MAHHTSKPFKKSQNIFFDPMDPDSKLKFRNTSFSLYNIGFLK